jgi:hypothetical protein
MKAVFLHFYGTFIFFKLAVINEVEKRRRCRSVETTHGAANELKINFIWNFPPSTSPFASITKSETRNPG